MKTGPKSQHALFPEECLLREIARQPRLNIGIPKENPEIETRLTLTPEGVSILTEEGHHVIVQRGAGDPLSYSDLQFSEAGAIVVDDISDVYGADIVLKVAPPTVSELSLMRDKCTIFSMLQLTNFSAECIKLMMKKKLNAFGYELIKNEQKAYPVLASVAEIEGNTVIALVSELMSVERGGKGIMLGNVAGISPTEIVILGAGAAGDVAVRTANALGAQVKVFDHNINKLRKLQERYGQHIFTSVIHPAVLIKSLKTADAVIGNLRYINGSERFLVSEELVKTMKPGAIIVDISIDQGGCFETSECRTLKNPIYKKHDVIHYCIPNISARVARTTSMALSNILSPLLLRIANSGCVDSAITESIGFRNGAYIYGGVLVNKHIGTYFDIPYSDIGLLMARY
jgi:alanine dehydrogenase